MVFDVRILAPIVGATGLLIAILLLFVVLKQPTGNVKMQSIAREIAAGAITFLRAEYGRIGIFVVVIGVLIAVFIGPWVALSFLLGTIAASAVSWIGVAISTRSNVRTAEAARTLGINVALRTAINSAAIIGITLSGLGILALGGLFYFFGLSPEALAANLVGFAIGASSIALFTRLGGGIFAKAADIGADLVGKLDAGIPEDDARNPGVIADNVGDNVGDIAGFGADIFESYVGAIVAAMVLATTMTEVEIKALFGGADLDLLIGLPLVLASIGLGASVLGIFAINLVRKFLPGKIVVIGETVALVAFLAATIGLLLTGGFTTNIFAVVVIGVTTGFFISKTIQVYMNFWPIRQLLERSKSGVAVNVISGLACGLESAILPLALVAVAIICAFNIAGLYGVALLAVGMLSTVAMLATLNACNPIADNAAAIAEMADLGGEVRKVTDQLASVGHITGAVAKSFSVTAASITSLALFVVFEKAIQRHNVELNFNIGNPKILAGAFIGAMVVLLVSSFTIKAVGRATAKIVAEIRRQFREIPGLLNGTGRPDNARCIEISSEAALKEMSLPVLIAVIVPVLIGKLAGVEALGGLVFGAIVVGISLSLTMTNSGLIWQSARKKIETGEVSDEKRGGKTHQATVVGDTIGDSLKDAAGPALNILIKLMAAIALLIVSIL